MVIRIKKDKVVRMCDSCPLAPFAGILSSAESNRGVASFFPPDVFISKETTALRTASKSTGFVGFDSLIIFLYDWNKLYISSPVCCLPSDVLLK